MIKWLMTVFTTYNVAGWHGVKFLFTRREITEEDVRRLYDPNRPRKSLFEPLDPPK